MCINNLNLQETEEEILKMISNIEVNNKVIKNKLEEYENTNKKRNLIIDQILNNNSFLIQDSI